jgi:hypothetical protein
MKRLLASAWLVMLTGILTAQAPATGIVDDFNFILHLAHQRMFTEAEQEKDRFLKTSGVDSVYSDSVYFALGKAYDDDGKPAEARRSYRGVSDRTSLYYPARYRAIARAVELEIDSSAFSEAREIEASNNAALNELKTFETAGLALLNGNVRYYDSLAPSLAFSEPMLNEESANLKSYRTAITRNKRKSPFLSGAMSAVVPGLGKVYVGNNGQALASFLTCALMGGVAVENYYHLGPAHPQTLFFGALFGVFYVGNIWGSAVSVQLSKIEKDLENRHNIRVAVRLPIDRLFR